MLGALLLQLYEDIMGYPYGGRQFNWLKSQRDRDRLLKEDEDLMTIITTLVTQDMLDG